MIKISLYNKTDFEPRLLTLYSLEALKVINLFNDDILLYKVFDEEAKENTYYDHNLNKINFTKFLMFNRHRTIQIALGVSL